LNEVSLSAGPFVLGVDETGRPQYGCELVEVAVYIADDDDACGLRELIFGSPKRE